MIILRKSQTKMKMPNSSNTVFLAHSVAGAASVCIQSIH